MFVPGVSRNPTGMKPGTRHRATRLAEKLMADDAEDVVKAVVTAAKKGDMTAARLVLDRIAPPCKGRRVRLALPPIDEPQAWADARLLDAWLAEAGDSPIGDVLRLGPGPLRDKARRKPSILAALAHPNLSGVSPQFAARVSAEDRDDIAAGDIALGTVHLDLHRRTGV